MLRIRTPYERLLDGLRHCAKKIGKEPLPKFELNLSVNSLGRNKDSIDFETNICEVLFQDFKKKFELDNQTSMYDVYEEIEAVLGDYVHVEKSRFITNKIYFELGPKF